MTAPTPPAGAAPGVRPRPPALGRSHPPEQYAESLARRLDAHRGGERHPLLNAGEAEVVAALLDEPAALYPGPLGNLARGLAVTLYDRCGL
ncbi:hypothetical protein [Actinomadura harenae]|uniref:hypothetical protein n=1 Tax=Actinomadura harenae TaxID=2483351 RepID=UPI0013151606|nr:hypothetical protein [Actinomadura harenae]